MTYVSMSPDLFHPSTSGVAEGRGGSTAGSPPDARRTDPPGPERMPVFAKKPVVHRKKPAQSADLISNAQLTPVHWDTVRRLFRRALELGARRLSLTQCELDLAADCERPRHCERWARPSRPQHTKWIAGGDPGTPGVLSVILWTRCRSCRTCLRQRRRSWMARACLEAGRADRTWFGTLTLRPDAHYAMFARAMQRGHQKALHVAGLSSDEQFMLRDREIAHEIGLMFKRLRKAGHRFRYLCVVEAHKSGLPHYHILLHQYGELSWRDLDRAWPWGHSKWNLVESARAAAYATKYLSKSDRARVRASVRYGYDALSVVECDNSNVSPDTPGPPLSPPHGTELEGNMEA